MKIVKNNYKTTFEKTLIITQKLNFENQFTPTHRNTQTKVDRYDSSNR